MSRAERLTHDEAFCLSVLDDCEVITLAFAPVAAGDAPYVIPMNYVRQGNIVYTHCAPEGGHKLALMQACNKVGFNAFTDVKVIPEKTTTYYRSVCGSGSISMVENRQEKMDALTALSRRYKAACPNPLTEAALNRAAVLRIDVETLFGKRNPIV